MKMKQSSPEANASGQVANTRRSSMAPLALRGLIGGTVTIALLGLVGSSLHEIVLIAPFGASCVLLFAAPESPFAQPRNLVCGHLITASVGMAVLWLFGNAAWAIGLAVGIVIALMELTGTVHPPAGANPVVIMLAGKVKLGFLLMPILLGVGILLVMALAINNVLGRRWPVRWW